MPGRPDFIPGRELGRMFYHQIARPIVERVLPAGDYAAALIGKGSDVLGFDSPRSTDHDWGPRFQLFLPLDGFEGRARRLDEELAKGLPAEFKGFSVGVPESAEAAGRPHLVEITTVSGFLQRYIGVSALAALTPLDWLTFPEQRLLELTAGEVFHDPRGELTRARESLREYPRDVWLYRMACIWQRLYHAEAFIGRCAESQDLLGMKVVTARVVRDLMRLCFLVEKTYSPYDKWLGTAFCRLPCAGRMRPLMAAALDASDYPAVEQALTSLYSLLGEMHNALGVTGPLDTSARGFYSRPYQVIRAERFANALLRSIQSEELRRIPVRMGAIDQFIDCTDFIETVGMYRKVLGLYR